VRAAGAPQDVHFGWRLADIGPTVGMVHPARGGVHVGPGCSAGTGAIEQQSPDGTSSCWPRGLGHALGTFWLAASRAVFHRWHAKRRHAGAARPDIFRRDVGRYEPSFAALIAPQHGPRSGEEISCSVWVVVSPHRSLDCPADRPTGPINAAGLALEDPCPGTFTAHRLARVHKA